MPRAWQRVMRRSGIVAAVADYRMDFLNLGRNSTY